MQLIKVGTVKTKRFKAKALNKSIQQTGEMIAQIIMDDYVRF